MHKLRLQGHHKNKHVHGVASLLLTLDKSALQTIKFVISEAKRDTINLCVKLGKLYTLKWVLMTKIHTWKWWNLMFSLECLQPIPQVIFTKNPWEVTLHLNGKPVLFTIDIGVDVSVIPEAVFKQLQGVTLNPADCYLTGPGQN